jgi:hypothetical protein
MFERNETHNTKGKQAFRGCWRRMPRTREASESGLPNAAPAAGMALASINPGFNGYGGNHFAKYIQKKRSMSQLIVRAGEFTFQARFGEI